MNADLHTAQTVPCLSSGLPVQLLVEFPVRRAVRGSCTALVSDPHPLPMWRPTEDGSLIIVLWRAYRGVMMAVGAIVIYLCNRINRRIDSVLYQSNWRHRYFIYFRSLHPPVCIQIRELGGRFTSTKNHEEIRLHILLFAPMGVLLIASGKRRQPPEPDSTTNVCITFCLSPFRQYVECGVIRQLVS
jgi:hypothetical protein